jgi:hypothetical protein
MIDHCSLVWGGFPKPSLGPRADNVIIPLDLTQLFCPGFTLAAGPPSSFTTDGVDCCGGALWRACNLTSFSPCLTGPVDYPFASCQNKGPGFKSPGGYLCETGIPLLVLSRYTFHIKPSWKDWQLNLQFSNRFYLFCKLLRDMLKLLKNIPREQRN